MRVTTSNLLIYKCFCKSKIRVLIQMNFQIFWCLAFRNILIHIRNCTKIICFKICKEYIFRVCKMKHIVSSNLRHKQIFSKTSNVGNFCIYIHYNHYFRKLWEKKMKWWWMRKNLGGCGLERIGRILNVGSSTHKKKRKLKKKKYLQHHYLRYLHWYFLLKTKNILRTRVQKDPLPRGAEN